jgi:hypothetical protein
MERERLFLWEELRSKKEIPRIRRANSGLSLVVTARTNNVSSLLLPPMNEKSG